MLVSFVKTFWFYARSLPITNLVLVSYFSAVASQWAGGAPPPLFHWEKNKKVQLFFINSTPFKNLWMNFLSLLLRLAQRKTYRPTKMLFPVDYNCNVQVLVCSKICVEITKVWPKFLIFSWTVLYILDFWINCICMCINNLTFCVDKFLRLKFLW